MRAHELAQQNGDRSQFERAATLYAELLERAPGSSRAYEVRFYRAEVLFHRLERYEEAGRVYIALARQRPRGQFSRDALYNAVAALERVRDTAEQQEATEHPVDRDLLDAIAMHVRLFPESRDVAELRFREARLHQARGEHDIAVEVFLQLVEGSSDSPYAQPAAEQALRSLESLSRLDGAQSILDGARRLRASSALEGEREQRRLEEMIAEPR